MNPRYAVYFVPAADSALYRFGAAVLGYDGYTGSDVDFLDRLPMERAAWHDATREPRRYGFHATLKAPFHLANGCDETALLDALPTFCRSIESASVFEPIVASLAGFIAIVPTAADPAIDRLAAACVTAFDRFRAPSSGPDRDRRRVGLTAKTGRQPRPLGLSLRVRRLPLAPHADRPARGRPPCRRPGLSPEPLRRRPGCTPGARSTASRCCARIGPIPVSSSSAMRRLARPGSMRTHDRIPHMLIQVKAATHGTHQ